MQHGSRHKCRGGVTGGKGAAVGSVGAGLMHGLLGGFHRHRHHGIGCQGLHPEPCQIGAAVIACQIERRHHRIGRKADIVVDFGFEAFPGADARRRMHGLHLFCHHCRCNRGDSYISHMVLPRGISGHGVGHHRLRRPAHKAAEQRTHKCGYESEIRN